MFNTSRTFRRHTLPIVPITSLTFGGFAYASSVQGSAQAAYYMPQGGVPPYTLRIYTPFGNVGTVTGAAAGTWAYIAYTAQVYYGGSASDYVYCIATDAAGQTLTSSYSYDTIYYLNSATMGGNSGVLSVSAPPGSYYMYVYANMNSADPQGSATWYWRGNYGAGWNAWSSFQTTSCDSSGVYYYFSSGVGGLGTVGTQYQYYCVVSTHGLSATSNTLSYTVVA